jgi:hypothetical protein
MAGVLHAVRSSAPSFTFNYKVTASTTNFNLKAQALAAGWDGVIPLTANVTINNGVYLGSTTTSTPAFDTGTGFPAGSYLLLFNNNGNIVGAGGRGGNGGAYGTNGDNGSPGGLALRAQVPININNLGLIAGGGGGGGGGLSVNLGVGSDWRGGGGGGGGRGYVGGDGGSGGPGNISGSSGGQGSALSPGGGGASGWNANGNGGSGGDLGAAGNPGYVAAGGQPGAAINGNSFITWTSLGTRLGAIS